MNLSDVFTEIGGNVRSLLHRIAGLAGGSAGQVLTKVDATENNFGWADATGGGGEVTLDGVETLTNKTLQSPVVAPLGPNLVVGGGGDQVNHEPWDLSAWGNPPAWATAPNDTVLHTAGPGNTAPLAQTLSLTSGFHLMIVVPFTPPTAGHCTIVLATEGGDSSMTVVLDSLNAFAPLYAAANMFADPIASLTITPTEDFDGDVWAVTVTALLPEEGTPTRFSSPAGAFAEVRVVGDPGNPFQDSFAIGRDAFSQISIGSRNNLALGNKAGVQFIAGSHCTLIGAASACGLVRDYATAVGAVASAGDFATALGSGAQAVLARSTALGSSSSVTNANAVALGALTRTSRDASVAIGPRDVHVQGPGLGVIVQSPDGSADYRISVDNTGNVVTTLV